MAARMTFTRVADLNKALSKLPKQAASRLRDASKEIASHVSDDARLAAGRQGGIAALVGPTIRAARDRVPAIRMGNSTPLPESGDGWERSRSGPGQTVGDVMWGAEFGSKEHTQFAPWRGSGEGAGYFLWPTVRRESDWMQDAYSEALNDALQEIRP